MVNPDNDLDSDENEKDAEAVNRKKVLLYLVPVLVVIGLAVGLHYIFNKEHGNSINYSVVSNAADENGSEAGVTVFYDLPEINARLKSQGKGSVATMKITLELSNVDDAKQVETLLPRINDAVLSHTIALTEEEISGASGLYWLKEELLYRINLLIAPIRVNNINFKNFEIQAAAK